MTDYVCVYNPDVLQLCGIGNGGYCPVNKTTTTDRYTCEFCHEQQDGRRAPCKPDSGKTIVEVALERSLKQLVKSSYELKDKIAELEGAMALHQANEVFSQKGSKECCGNCKFFSSGIENVDVCRRYPPIVLGDSPTYESYFPDTNKDNWCGEWRLK